MSAQMASPSGRTSWLSHQDFTNLFPPSLQTVVRQWCHTVLLPPSLLTSLLLSFQYPGHSHLERIATQLDTSLSGKRIPILYLHHYFLCPSKLITLSNSATMKMSPAMAGSIKSKPIIPFFWHSAVLESEKLWPRHRLEYLFTASLAVESWNSSSFGIWKLGGSLMFAWHWSAPNYDRLWNALHVHLFIS